MELLIKRTLLVLFCAALFFVCCNKSEKVEKEDSPDFYELCFHFSKLPAKASLKDVETASKTFSGTLSAKVLSEKTTLFKSCRFLDKEPEFQGNFSGDTGNEAANYILKAFFNKESSSLYGIKNSGKIIKKIHDAVPLERKIPSAVTTGEGLEIKGRDAKIIRLSRYLDSLEIKNSLGSDRNTNFTLDVPADIQGRWKIALFLFSSLDLERVSKPQPGDFALLALCEDGKTTVSVKKSGWEKTKITKMTAENGLNAINFGLGASNIPFSEEIALKYLYSLAFSHRLSFENGSPNSPVFSFSSVNPMLYLFSGKLEFSAPVHDPEPLLLWILSSERQLETYPDELYANLLSLKIAKKLVFADTTFLGGKDLENKNQFIDFEAVRNSFFSGNLSVSGDMPDDFYIFSGETITESVETADIPEVSGFKALFGDPEINDTSIVTFVVRSANASEIIGKIEKSLEEKGFEPFHRMLENIKNGGAWGSVSVKTALSNESRLMNLYEKNYKTLDKTLSIGVYRVSEK